MIDVKSLSIEELQNLLQSIYQELSFRKDQECYDECMSRYFGRYYISNSHYVKVIGVKYYYDTGVELKCLVWNSDFDTNEGVFLENDTWYPRWIETAKEITEEEWLEVVTSGIKKIVRGDNNAE